MTALVFHSRLSVPHSFIPMPLARQPAHAFAAFRQCRFFDDENWETVFDLEGEGASLADEPVVFEEQFRPAGIERAAEDFEQVFANHGASIFIRVEVKFEHVVYLTDRLRQPHHPGDREDVPQ